MIEAIAGVIALVASVLAVFFKRRGDREKERADREESRANTQTDMRGYEREAQQMDDTSLADRISRRD